MTCQPCPILNAYPPLPAPKPMTFPAVIIPPTTYSLNYMIVGGGGSAGDASNANAGGGGGGGVLSSQLRVLSGNPISVTIGAGGVAVTTLNHTGYVGGNSTLAASKHGAVLINSTVEIFHARGAKSRRLLEVSAGGERAFFGVLMYGSFL